MMLRSPFLVLLFLLLFLLLVVVSLDPPRPKPEPEPEPEPNQFALLGVFCTAEDVEWRRLHRAYLSLFSSAEAVKVVFVVGRPGPAPDEDDVMVLDVRENMNLGKSFAFFREAAAARQARFIIKSDLDTFVHLDNLVAALRELDDEREIIYGRAIDERFMMGAIYGLTWRVAASVGQTTWWRTLGAEDQAVSSAVKRLGPGIQWVSDLNIYDHPDSARAFAAPFRNDTVALHQLKTLDRWFSTIAHYFGSETAYRVVLV